MLKKLVIAGTVAVAGFGGISEASAEVFPVESNMDVPDTQIAIESVYHDFWIGGYDSYIIDGQVDFPNYLRSVSISTAPGQYVCVELWDDLGLISETIVEGSEFVGLSAKPREGTLSIKIVNLSSWWQEINLSTMGY
ncbi:hypothetical protein WAK64_12980 [Bacillus spongiae]|uniref:Uncharacterized protein n=1 Tax=Bacillus spongiae TaxID=2683610 RepID=A0ABU8HFR4_9BACI